MFLKRPPLKKTTTHTINKKPKTNQNKIKQKCTRIHTQKYKKPKKYKQKKTNKNNKEPHHYLKYFLLYRMASYFRVHIQKFI